MSRRTGGASEAPVFLIGAPRSGTSLLYKSLALHEGFGYISNYNERLPRWSAAAALNRLPAALPERPPHGLVRGRERQRLRLQRAPAAGPQAAAHADRG